jgi:3-deoxy-7-phosphoheptulonate synthase
MLIFCRQDLTENERGAILDAARAAGFEPLELGSTRIALHGEGERAGLEALPGVLRIGALPDTPVLVNEPDRRVVRVGPVEIGTGFIVAAGPCAVEDRQRLLDLAHAAKAAGCDILRGGAYKPRTSPYSFRGLGDKGLEYLKAAGEATGLPVVTEVLDPRDVAVAAEHADMLQIGTRNMMNYSLLVEVGRADRPVLLKRGMAATLAEFVFAAEYILLEGAPGVVLCERGIRSPEPSMRNTLDLAAVPALRHQTNLSVIVDPSHATGRRELVPPMTRAAAAAGADGVMIEIHDAPDQALCDGKQAVHPDRLAALVENLRKIAALAAEAEESQ